MKNTFYLMGISSILFLFVGFTIYFTNTYAHEEAHKQFSIYNGCNKYEINHIWNPHFQCLNRSNTPTKESIEKELMLDSINEIMTYNMITTWMAILLGSYLICITMILIKGTDTP